jgi:hypothetical protein
MKKTEAINQINNRPASTGIVFTEVLDDGRKNERTIQGNIDNLITILQEQFDDDMHGHFGDEVFTTIKSVGYYLLTTTEV